MRAQEFILEKVMPEMSRDHSLNVTVKRGGITLRAYIVTAGVLRIIAMAGGKEIGKTVFVDFGKSIQAMTVDVDDRYQRQGIATLMYDFAEELGNDVDPSSALSDAGKAFWANRRPESVTESIDFTNAVNSIEKLVRTNNIEFSSFEDLVKFIASRKFLQPQRNDQRFINDVAGAVLRRLHTPVTEVRSDDQEWDDDEEYDELLVSQRITNYFIKRGYGYLGEGREQIALLSPRGTVVKILGQGDPERQNVVKEYVKFFQQNQRNPHYPRIYNTNDFTVEGETYFIYEMEYLNRVSGEEEVLEYIEDLMSSLPRGEQALYAFQKNRKMPKDLTPEQVDGLIAATQDLEDFLGGVAPLDLRAIENLGSRDNGQLVIIDPYSL